MGSSDDVDRVPSYEESVGLPRPADYAPASQEKPPSRHVSSTSTAFPSPLHDQLETVREQRIQNLTARYIQPLISEQGLSGLYKTSFILVPSNMTALQNADQAKGADVIEGFGAELDRHGDAEAVVGFPPEDYVKLVRLKGEENRLEFLRQDAVLAELRSALQAQLNATGHRQAVLPTPSTAPDQPATLPPPSTKGGVLGSLFRRAKGDQLSHDSALFGLHPLGAAGSSSSNPLSPGEVKVEVSLCTVSIRTTSAFGLWETRTGEAINVTIEVGSSRSTDHV